MYGSFDDDGKRLRFSAAALSASFIGIPRCVAARLLAMSLAALMMTAIASRGDEPAAPQTAAAAAAPAKAVDTVAPIVDPDNPMSTEISAEEAACVEEIAEEVRRLWQKKPRTPLPANTKALSANERLRQYNDWIESLYVDAWRAHGKRDPRWDDQAIALLRDFVRPPSTPLSQRDITIRVRQLLAKGCDDILMRYALARSFDLSAGHACYKAINLMRPKLETLGPDYPAQVAYKIELRYVAAWNRGYHNKPGPLAPTVERMIDRIVQMISGPLTNEERRRHVHRLVVDLGGSLGRYDELLFKKLALAPDADRWLVQLLLAEAHLQRGWQARGGGWASEVTAKGWQDFGAHLAKARSLRLQAWKEHPELPEAALGMITVTMAGDGVAGEDCRFWLDRAVDADFDMSAAYKALLYALRPRWGGSHEEMLAFGRECLATKRFDLGVPWNFHSALADVLSEVDDPRRVCTAADVYDDYLTLLDGSRPLAEDDDERHVLDTSRACIAWLTSHDDEARRFLEELGDEVVADVFPGLHTTLSDVRLSLAGGKRAPPGERWPDCGVEQLRFAAEASQLLGFGTRAGLKVWDMANGGQLAFELPMKVDGRLMRDVDISPDGSLLAMILFDEANEMHTGSVVLWDVEAQKVRSTLPPPPGRPAYRLRFSPDGKRLAAGMLDGSLTIWDVETGKRPEWAHWLAHASWVQTLAFTADGAHLATAGGDWNVMYWNLPEPGDASAQPPKAQATWGPFAGMPMSLNFFPDGKRLLIGHNYCDTWDVMTGKPVRRLPGTYAAYSPDGQTVATGGVELTNTARLWNAETGRERAQMVGGHQHGVTTLIFSPNGRRVITGSASKTGVSGQWEAAIRCWDANTGEEIFDFSGCCD